MIDHDIARWRLRSQRLVRPHAASAGEVIDGLLAVQAENPGQSAWAVASRTAEPSRGDLAGLLATGAVVRTHVLRTTWHYVAAADIGWLLDATGPRVRRITAAALRSAYKLDGATIARAQAIVLDTLGATPDLTRPELAAALGAAGIDLTGPALMILLADLELDQQLISGRPRGEEHTYARFVDRVPVPRRLGPEAALGELAVRYFTGHGPATERDLSYWATLPVTDVRRGLKLAGDRLASFSHDGRTYWHAAGERPAAPAPPAGQLLQILDELYRGYQDSRWVLDASGIVPRDRASALGMAVVDAQLVAGMKRSVTATRLTVQLTPYRPLTRDDTAALDAAAERYRRFLGVGSVALTA